MLVTSVPKKEVHRDDDGHTQASVRRADPLPPLVPLSPSLLSPDILRTRVGVNGCGRGCSYPIYAVLPIPPSNLYDISA